MALINPNVAWKLIRNSADIAFLIVKKKGPGFTVFPGPISYSQLVQSASFFYYLMLYKFSRNLVSWERASAEVHGSSRMDLDYVNKKTPPQFSRGL